MRKAAGRDRRQSIVAARIALAVLAGVVMLFAFACSDAGPTPAASAPAPGTPETLRPVVLPDLAAKGVTLESGMTLYEPRASDAAAVTNADAVASAQAFYPFAHLGEARLLLMTDSQIPSPRLVWIVTVLDKPFFVGGGAGAPTPDPSRPSYNLVFVDATTGKAMFGASGEKVN